MEAEAEDYPSPLLPSDQFQYLDHLLLVKGARFSR